LILIISLVLVNTRTTNKKSQSKAAMKWIRPMIKTAKSYISFANLAYCDSDVINALSCPLCSDILDLSFRVVDHFTTLARGRKYQFVFLVSELHREIIISFAGPKANTDPAFYSTIYQSGFGQLHGELIENAFLKVYSDHFQIPLKRQIMDFFIRSPGARDYKFILVGHSFGGSLAVIAAFDLIVNNLIPYNQLNDSPLVYTYGQLRVGDEHFVERVNSLFKVIRINRSGDVMTRLPNCVWSHSLGKWRCYRDTWHLFLRFPEYRRYYTEYAGSQNFANYKSQVTQSPQDSQIGSAPHVVKPVVRPTRSFLEKSSRASSKGYYYSFNNPGNRVYSYGSTLTNQGALSYGNVYYSQPLGSEVVYSKNFKTFQVCSYMQGIPDCERQLPPTFRTRQHSNYFNTHVDEC
jgi:hypothetical protein